MEALLLPGTASGLPSGQRGHELGQVKRQVPGQPREPLAGNNRWWWGQDSRQENEDHKRRANSDVKAWSNQGVWASASACFHVRETL